jgi:ABC-type transporter Mla subunit MlaD
LTTALDAQRDVLNGLLSRLGLAQDETAAIAERTAARITDSAQQVTRQAEAMGAQAQNALSSIHAAASSFAEEAGTLGMQAQQAEQQMRGVLSVTAGMQEQARQLREAMQSETARVIEQLNAALAQLDVAGNQLKLQNGAAMHSMDQTVLQFAALTKTGADAMQRQAEIMDRSGEKLSTHIKLVNEAGAITEGQANRLGDAAARVAEIKSALQGELTRLNDLSERAIRQVLDASQELAGKSDTLRANLAASESALQQAATLVRDESVQMPATLDRSTAQIEAASRVLKAQAGETDGMLIGVADRFIAVTTTARNSMTEEMRRIGAVAEEADKVLRHFNTGLTEQVGSMRQSAAVLSSEQKELVTRAHDSVAQLAAASERLGQLRSDAVATAERLGQHFDNLDQRATAASERLTETAEVAAKQMDVLAEATKRADGQMQSATNQFREQFERIRAGLQGQIDDINRGLMQITAQLERTGTTLRSTTAGTVADVERISQRFDQTSREAGAQLAEKTARMRGATEEVAKLLGGFGDQIDVLLDRLAMAGDGIRRHEGDLVNQLQTALSHLGSVAERLETSRALATNVSEQAASRLNDVVETIQHEMQGVASGTQTAAGVLRGLGQIYGDQAQALNSGLKDTRTEMQAMNSSIDEMQQRADRMRVSLKLQGDELMTSLQDILQQLGNAGEALNEAAEDRDQKKNVG